MLAPRVNGSIYKNVDFDEFVVMQKYREKFAFLRKFLFLHNCGVRTKQISNQAI